jgi:hypothetical protein
MEAFSSKLDRTEWSNAHGQAVLSRSGENITETISFLHGSFEIFPDLRTSHESITSLALEQSAESSKQVADLNHDSSGGNPLKPAYSGRLSENHASAQAIENLRRLVSSRLRSELVRKTMA